MSDDPRDASKESTVTLPRSWAVEDSDFTGGGGMFLSGMVFVSKNRYLGWSNLLIAMSSWINAHPMRTKEGGLGGPSSVGIATLALFMTYLQAMTLPAPFERPKA